MLIEKLPTDTSLDKVEIWFQDEARIGQQGTLTRVWARKGTRPRLIKQQQFINSYIFGAVCPERDIGAALVLPSADISSMKRHLQEISLNVQQGYHAVVILDQARWHVSKNLHIPKNITLMPLPPYSPELNPQENVWQFMRQNYLANKCFESLNDILDNCSRAWNEFTRKDGRIKNMCSREWANTSAYFV